MTDTVASPAGSARARNRGLPGAEIENLRRRALPPQRWYRGHASAAVVDGAGITLSEQPLPGLTPTRTREAAIGGRSFGPVRRSAHIPSHVPARGARRDWPSSRARRRSHSIRITATGVIRSSPQRRRIVSDSLTTPASSTASATKAGARSSPPIERPAGASARGAAAPAAPIGLLVITDVSSA